MTQIVTTANAKEAVSGNHITVLDFWATWCAPCRHLLPIINELATEYEGRVFIGKVDAEAEEALPTNTAYRLCLPSSSSKMG